MSNRRKVPRRGIYRELATSGWSLSPTRNGHWRATHPDASSPLILDSTPSDWRAEANTRARAARLLRVQPDPTHEQEPTMTETAAVTETPTMYVYRTTGRVSTCIRVDGDGVRCTLCDWHRPNAAGAHIHDLSHTDPEAVKARAARGGRSKRHLAVAEPEPVPTPEDIQSQYVHEALTILANALGVTLTDEAKVEALQAEVETLRAKLALISEAVGL